MKIFAIINNHSDGLFGDSDATPDWYEMPDSSVLRTGNPFFVPDFSEEFAAFPTAVYRIGRLGKSISPRFASRYVESATMGVAIIATDLLRKLQAEGRPWTRAVAFDRSCILGDFIPIDDFEQIKSFDVCLGDHISTYVPSAIRHPYASILSWVSEDNTIKNGDMILAGLPGVGIPLAAGTRLTISPSPNDNNAHSHILEVNIR